MIISNNKKGFTLIDVLIGVALILIIFVGIFGAFRMGMKTIEQSRNGITASSIANHQIELIRNLPYGSIGIQGEFPDGTLEASTSIIINNVEYLIERRIDFVVDSTDGVTLPEDDCPNDYKRVKVKVSWTGRFEGEVEISTDISPKNLAQECADEGGILSVSVFDAFGIMVSFPVIEIRNPDTDEVLKTATPDDGQHYFSLATSTYKVVVTKAGFSNERTYGTDEVTTPEKPHSMVLEGQLTEISFSIDEVSTFSVNTLSPWGSDSFSDSFADANKISEYLDIAVTEGEARLATTVDEGYSLSGYLLSSLISPGTIIRWDEFSWTESEPVNTGLDCQVYYASGTDWYLIPDTDLAGNSAGFPNSPVDLSILSTSTYSLLKLRGNLSTSDTSTTPSLEDWQISWITINTTSIASVTFSLQGAKLIGTDAADGPVYKYSNDHTSNGLGYIDIANLEWDTYTFSIDPASGLDLISTDPTPQPISLPPDNVTQSVALYLEAENSLLVTVKNVTTLDPIFAAEVRLYNIGLGYDISQYTNENGQTYFTPLEVAIYDLDIQAPGFLSNSTTVNISGDKTETVSLEQIE